MKSSTHLVHLLILMSLAVVAVMYRFSNSIEEDFTVSLMQNLIITSYVIRTKVRKQNYNKDKNNEMRQVTHFLVTAAFRLYLF